MWADKTGVSGDSYIFALPELFDAKICINNTFLEIILLYAGLFKMPIKFLEG
jgi:hypothetical protein